MSEPTQPVEVDVVDDPARAQVMLQPQRLQLLEALAVPASAAALSRQLGLPRQRINYHLKELESQRLIELIEERRRGNVVERIYRRTGSSYAISTAALGALGTTPATIEDRFSSAYQIALASQAVCELGALQVGAVAAGKQLPTFALETEVRFASPQDRAAFAAGLAEAVADLVQRYHDQSAPGGRKFQVYLGAYPRRDGG